MRWPISWLLHRIAPATAMFAVALGACGRIGYDEIVGDARSAADSAAASDAWPGDAMIAVEIDPDAAPVLDCGGSIVCYGFDGDLAAWTTRGTVEPRATYALVTEPVVDGTGALRFSFRDVPAGTMRMIERRFPAIMAGTLHARALLRVSAATTFDHFLVALQLDSGNDTGFEKISVDLMPDDQLALGVTSANPDVWPTGAAGTVTHDDWMCLRLEVAVAQAGGHATLWRGDQLVASATGVDTHPEPSGINRLLIGIAVPGRATADLVFDAVALGSTRLPCP
jgi:hypothetical protein